MRLAFVMTIYNKAPKSLDYLKNVKKKYLHLAVEQK